MTRFDPPGGRPWGLFGLCGASLLLNLVLGTRLLLAPAAPTPTAAAVPAADPPVAAAVQQVPDEALAAVDVGAEDGPSIYDKPATERRAGATGVPSTLQVRSLPVVNSLSHTFAKGIGDDGRFVSAVFARLYAFDMDLRRDVMKGDTLDVAWEGTGPDAQVVASRYHSKRHGTLAAYRFQLEGERYPRWFNEHGEDVARELIDSPLASYEQITSLLHDRPRHRGMDFKADTGTPVLSGRAGKVTRVNWNTGINGGCIEVRYDDGTLARYLHLSDTRVKAGDRVAKGAVMGESGNTGRSTAPHLHYELEKGGRVVDPIDYHGVQRRSVPESQRAAFQAAVAQMNQWLDAGGDRL